MVAVSESVVDVPDVSEHARTQFIKRTEDPSLTVETAWSQGYEIPGRGWLRGERARYDPCSRCVFPVRDGKIRTAIYAPTAKDRIRRAVRSAGWCP